MTKRSFANVNDVVDLLKGTERFLIGYDRMYDQLSRAQNQSAKTLTNYPPYNIRKTDENSYVIEMAVAGFSESEIEVKVVADGKLLVNGTANHSDENIIYHGLAHRDFSRSFTLDDQVVVNSATMSNGLLEIHLDRIVPEAKVDKKIPINGPKGDKKKQFLTG